MEIKKVLISQPSPSGASPYNELVSKYGLDIDFKPFFKTEGVSLKDFISQKVEILEYTAVVFTSRTAIDSFFSICEQSRILVPETMKYFCQSEAIAAYLQKYIVYRKRKIFFGNGTADSILDAIGTKHKTEHMLIACTDCLKPDMKKLFTAAKLKYGSAVFVRTVSNEMKDLDLGSYDVIAFYSPSDVKSLQENFPEYSQGSTRFIAFGKNTAKSMADASLDVTIQAPSPEVPSVAEALFKLIESK